MSLATRPRRLMTPVCPETLAKAVATVEKDGPCEKQLDLLHAVAKLYNANRPAGMPAISYTVARLRIGEWAIPHATKPTIHAIRRGS